MLYSVGIRPVSVEDVVVVPLHDVGDARETSRITSIGETVEVVLQIKVRDLAFEVGLKVNIKVSLKVSLKVKSERIIQQNQMIYKNQRGYSKKGRSR